MEKPASPDIIAHRTRLASRKDSVCEQAPPPLDTKHQQPTDYIAPPLRRLGQYERLLHNVSSTEVTNLVDFGLQKAVGLVVKSVKPDAGFSGEFLQELTILASGHMRNLFRLLHDLTEVQRHHRPGIADLQMCLVQHNLSAGQLGREFDRTVSVSPSVKALSAALRGQVESLLREYYAENYHLDKDDPSLVFHANEQYEVAALVPRQSKKRTYIPSYLPELPPDFTYQYTGNYMKTLTDLKEIKLKLVDESRLNEASLYKLIEDDEKEWNVTSDLESDPDDIMSQVDPVSDVESSHEKEAEKGPIDSRPDPNLSQDPPDTSKEEPSPGLELRSISAGKKFDFVAYARSRRLAQQRQARELETRRRKRNENVFMRAERLLSCYATAPAGADRDFITRTLQNGFKKVIRATRRAEQAKKRKLTELLALKAKAEQEHEQNNAIEFGFAFNHASNLSDSDDDEEPEEFDFGDAEPNDEEKPANLQRATENAIAPKQSSEGHSQLGEGDSQLGEGDFYGALPAPQSGSADLAQIDNELDSALNSMDPSHAALASAEAWPEEWQSEPQQQDSDEDELEDL